MKWVQCIIISIVHITFMFFKKCHHILDVIYITYYRGNFNGFLVQDLKAFNFLIFKMFTYESKI